MSVSGHHGLPGPPSKKSFFRKIFSFSRPSPPGLLHKPPNISIVTPLSERDTAIQHDVNSTRLNTFPPVSNSSPTSSTSCRNQDCSRFTTQHADGIQHVERADVTSSYRSQSAVAAFFSGAHNFTIQNSTLAESVVQNNIVYKIDGKPFNDPLFLQQFLQNLDSGGTVLLLLNKERVRGAEVDSSDRDPPPRCHPETRRELLDILFSWASNPKRLRLFIWLSGPAGAGKSAVAQTFAEHCQKLDILGASFFFSKLQQHASPKGIIATVAYQLAKRDAGYNHLITRILSQDPSILDMTMRIQFHKLIIEPFAFLGAQHTAASTTRKPLVVIIDGVDECSDESTQCQLVTLIGDYVHQLIASPCPLLWLVCSRPEWHLKRTFAKADPPIDCRYEEMTCDAEEDITDVYHILKDGLQKIHNQAGWDLSPNQARSRWPTETKLQILSQKIGGLPILASAILNFIDNGTLPPDTQLDICLAYLDAIGTRDKLSPLEALDAFYTQIMMRVAPAVLPTTKRIIAFYILCHSYENFYDLKLEKFTQFDRVSEVGRFLGIHEDAFYSALRNLHSVIAIPSVDLAHEKPLAFFHKSFTDYLQDPARSKSFALEMNQARYDHTILSLRWYNHVLRSKCRLEHCPISARNESSSLDCVRWISDSAHNMRIYDFVRFNIWDMCRTIEESRRPGIMAEFLEFDFCHFSTEWSIHEDKHFRLFLKWLTEDANSRLPDETHSEWHDIVRFHLSSEVDEALAKRFTEPLPLGDSFPSDLATNDLRWFSFVSLHRPNDVLPSLEGRMAFWIGKGERSVLVLMT